jgi:hypothetical protein
MDRSGGKQFENEGGKDRDPLQCEATREARPLIHFQQQIGDLHMREHPIQPLAEFVGFALAYVNFPFLK